MPSKKNIIDMLKRPIYDVVLCVDMYTRPVGSSIDDVHSIDDFSRFDWQ